MLFVSILQHLMCRTVSMTPLGAQACNPSRLCKHTSHVELSTGSCQALRQTDYIIAGVAGCSLRLHRQLSY